MRQTFNKEFEMCTLIWFCVYMYYKLVCVKLQCKLVFKYSYTVNWFCVHLYCKLVLSTTVLQTGFVGICTVNRFCVHLICKLVLCTPVLKNGFVCTCTVNTQTLQVRRIYRGQTLHKSVFCLLMHY